MAESVSKLRLWLLAARPKTLPAAVGPVLVGTAVAFRDGLFQPVLAFLALLGAVLLQVAVNFANDYFDAKNDIDSENRLGPVRVTQAGLIAPNEVKRAMMLTLILAALLFGGLAVVGGPVLIAVGILSILSALAYSGGPYPIASHGLGELFVLIFFGPVAVCSTYYLQAGHFSLFSLVVSLIPGLLVTEIMVINNLRDIPTDRVAGKRTLAVRLGREKTILFFRALLLLTYIIPLLLIALGLGTGKELLIFASAPLAITLFNEVKTFTGCLLNETLARTAQLSFFASFAFSLGLIF